MLGGWDPQVLIGQMFKSDQAGSVAGVTQEADSSPMADDRKVVLRSESFDIAVENVKKPETSSHWRSDYGRGYRNRNEWPPPRTTKLAWTVISAAGTDCGGFPKAGRLGGFDS